MVTEWKPHEIAADLEVRATAGLEAGAALFEAVGRVRSVEARFRDLKAAPSAGDLPFSDISGAALRQKQNARTGTGAVLAGCTDFSGAPNKLR